MPGRLYRAQNGIYVLQIEDVCPVIYDIITGHIATAWLRSLCHRQGRYPVTKLGSQSPHNDKAPHSLCDPPPPYSPLCL